MLVFSGHADAGLAALPSAVAIGVLDGVHAGHQALVAEVGRLAGEDPRAPLRRVAYTFDPHPARLLRPTLAPPLIEPLARRLERLAAAGIEVAVVQPFDPPLAAMSAAAFFGQVLVARLAARAVVVGEGFRFGRGQEGSVAALSTMGAAQQVVVRAVGHVRRGGIEVSSTKVRGLVQEGRVEGAALLLGHLFELAGRVAPGAGRGRTLGFPTANLETTGELVPARGVYAAWAARAGAAEAAVVNVGLAPTFGARARVRIEAHLLDYHGPPFYGDEMTLRFVGRVRDEERFAGPEALVDQIRRDVGRCRELLAAGADS